jgi:hypothetical protein
MFDASRYDWLFVLVADGRRWFIPSTAIEARRSICLGGPKYSEFEVEHGRPFAEAGQGRSLNCATARRDSEVVKRTAL